MNYSYKLDIISLHGKIYVLNKLTSLPMCGFMTQLVEHRTGIMEVTGSNPVEALIFFSNCLNWKIYCNDHSSLSLLIIIIIVTIIIIIIIPRLRSSTK